jgi:23S rRNA (pseudouridine1915-N3)-methyltransferase
MISKVTFINFGKFKNKNYENLFNDYVKRISHYVKLEVKEIKVKDDSESFFNKNKEKFENLIDGKLVLLTEHGKNLNNKDFKNYFIKLEGPITIIVGTSWGIPQYLYKEANLILSLSKMVLPHEMARTIIAEQVYRTLTIIKGEKYHK